MPFIKFCQFWTLPKEETIFHSNIKNWWIFPFRRFDSPRKIYKFFHEVSNMLTQKENIAKFFTIFSKILFHSSSNDPIFPKEKSQFQFLRQRTQVQFDPLFKKKKKNYHFYLEGRSRIILPDSIPIYRVEPRSIISFSIKPQPRREFVSFATKFQAARPIGI